MKVLIWIVIIIAVLGGGYYLLQGGMPAPEGGSVENTMPVPDGSGTNVPEMIVGDDTSAESSIPTTATFTYNGTSFSPAEVTIKKGGTVTWKNASDKDMWVASAMHPSHIVYSGTSRQEHCPDTSKTAFDQCAVGDDYSFTFDKTGAWGFHDHINSSVFGKVNVVE